MPAQKSVKDSVHGYIEYDETFRKIIDTPEFQRLKWVEQTSYRVLYPSARHDRFIHSLGVFHLGGIAFDALMMEKDGVISDAQEHAKMNATSVAELRETFLAACLLHDVGHAPMSHTLEDLYFQGSNSKILDGPLHKRLFTALGKHRDNLSSDSIDDFETHYRGMYAKESNVIQPKAHEIVSSIVVLERAHELNLSQTMFKNLDLIIRAILGCTYLIGAGDREIKAALGIKNCLIRLLNGRSIDVDKLDYIARDTTMSGHKNASIDNIRLLRAMTAIEDGHRNLHPAFRKSALSAIKNVVFAKNSQARWIISHPAVVYESYLVNKSIEDMAQLFVRKYCHDREDLTPCPESICKEEACKNHKCAIREPNDLLKRLFSVDALSIDGVSIQGRSFRLLCDADIIALMKEFINDSSYIRQLFDRSRRHKPLWKSPEEYNYLFNKKTENAKNGLDKCQEVVNFFRPILSNEKNTKKAMLVDDDLYRFAVEENNEKMIAAIDFLRKFADDGNFVLLPFSGKFHTDIDYDQTYFVFDTAAGGYATYRSLEGDLLEVPESPNEKDGVGAFYLHCPFRADRKKVLDQLYNQVGGVYGRV